MPIHLLPTEVASQIAAGEVVERPASVVKELIENALDAGATHISIGVEGAGQQLIEVGDNGCGIPASELPLAIERHATSKLSQAADLFHIHTLGFRGEALASIGSISCLTLTSRQADQASGARLRVEAGLASPVQPVGAPVGTQVRVENLFFNVPARLKFLKTDATERRLIDTVVARYALAYPQVRFQLQQDRQPALQTSGNGERREILAALFDADIARQMLSVISSDEHLAVEGFISPAALTRSHRRDMTFFVNGRPVQDATLASAVLRAYHTLLMVGRFPIALLFITLPPEAVDVNVHPTKAEVRFREADKVFSSIQSAVRRALLAHSPVPGIQPTVHWETNPRWVQTVPTNPATAGNWPAFSDDFSERPMQATPDASQAPGTPNPGDFEQNNLPESRVPLLRLIGQIANAYLVAEGPDGLYLVDQHAAHERVLFEHWLAARRGQVPSQALLQPATLELPAAAARLLSDQLPGLTRLGFQVEAFGPRTFLVRAIPSILGEIDPAAAIRVVIEDFEEDETPLQAELDTRLAARICKRLAVKAGHPLSPAEQRKLLEDLEGCQSPRTCPHGRPTMIHLSVDLLERQFGRRGSR